MQVLGQINQRFDELTGEITIEVRKQCDTTKQVSSSNTLHLENIFFILL